jgi:hypothetical protein
MHTPVQLLVPGQLRERHSSQKRSYFKRQVQGLGRDCERKTPRQTGDEKSVR